MRIGINLLHLSQDRYGGVEQYIRNLVWYLANTEKKVKLFLFLNRPNRDLFPDHVKNIKQIMFKNIEKESQIIEAIHENRIDVWFCPLHRSYLPNIPVPTVVTIHDVLHTAYPQFVPGELEWNNQYYEHYAPTFDAVITVSEFSKKSILEQLRIPKEKVYAIYQDVPMEFKQNMNKKHIIKTKKKYQLPDTYALYPASYNPHKNHLNLLKAILLLRDKYNKSIPLVLTGYTDEKNTIYQSAVKFLKDHSLDGQVKILGYIPPEDMPSLFINSRFLIFPSLYEGFGIPLVEAMKTKTPIVCSNRGSIPEVAADSALLFNPEDAKEIALQILRIMKKKTRNSLIEKGIRRSKAFSWEKSAKETLKVFRSVLR
ncbi:alpha-1,3-rhamnosyl/mannosyltransferase [Peribacillus deserti]|uniref:Alpha-1,3-rhamnosyl/mannosyltransferase n=1 Tax=Peribacillus deserti TaxID=673318 RepID=A0ABS2QE80_9BACI|nr:glycosyltransferase family 1 protein [Peribacillus deserti]MBM7691476.1 alpha-1,3-rhamnosyl/mannosyltransferase [Peribacillus deserti]